MRRFEPSIDVALSTEPAEELVRTQVVVPITSTESLVASRGLAVHLDILYRSVAKNSDENRALMAIYDFLTEDIDKFRRQAYRLADALEPSSDSLVPPRTAGAALAVAILLSGQRSHRTGVWLKGNAKAKQLVEQFHEVLGTDTFTFYERAQWARTQTVRNTVYWRQELEKIRDNRYINLLRQAIDESDHQLEEPEV